MLRGNGWKFAPVGFEKVCGNPESDFVDTAAFWLDIRGKIWFLPGFSRGFGDEVIVLRAGDFAPELEFLDLFGDGESFKGLEEKVSLFFA